MKVYVELKSGKIIESLIWFERLEESLLQLLGVLSSFHQTAISEIVSIKYNPMRYDFQPYEIYDFKNEVCPSLIRDVIVRYQILKFN
jgi:hypothetical protein